MSQKGQAYNNYLIRSISSRVFCVTANTWFVLIYQLVIITCTYTALVPEKFFFSVSWFSSQRKIFLALQQNSKVYAWNLRNDLLNKQIKSQTKGGKRYYEQIQRKSKSVHVCP